MRHTIILVSLFLFSNCKIDTGSNKKSISSKTGEDMELEALSNFKEDPILSIPVFEATAKIYKQEGNQTKEAICFLNIANIFDEYKSDLDSALYFAEKSLHIWQLKNDSLQVANLLKYRGLLYGKLKNLEKATSDINLAITYYSSMNFPQGIAVSQFNLAESYFENGEANKAMKTLDFSSEYWRKANNLSRLFSNNLLEMKIRNYLDHSEKVIELKEENENIMSQININEFLINKFQTILTELKIEN